MQAYGFDFENEKREDGENPMYERATFQYAQDISHIACQEGM